MIVARPALAHLVLLWSIAPLFAVSMAHAQVQPSPALPNPLAAQPLDQLSTTLERPLFSPSRRPPAPPPPPAVVVQAPPPPVPPPLPPNVVLFGVVMDGETARAVLRPGIDKKVMRAQIGDDIDGWKVAQIEARKVVLAQDGRFATFMLFNDDRAKSATAPASGMSGQPKNTAQQIEVQQAIAPAPPGSAQPKRRRRSKE
jgi:hypothetical protein